MPKPYIDELASWVKKRNATRPRQDRAAVEFLAVKKDIIAALNAGYTKKTIWEHMHETGKITSRYETFLKHIKKHISDSALEEQEKPQEQPTQETPPTPAKDTSSVKQPDKDKSISGFEFNAKPSKEDLI